MEEKLTKENKGDCNGAVMNGKMKTYRSEVPFTLMRGFYEGRSDQLCQER